MAYQNILLEQPGPGIYLLTVNRPRALNALNAATLDEIAAALSRVAADEAARVLLVTGGGEKAFVAGADIAEMQSATVEQAREFSEKGIRVMHALETDLFARAFGTQDRKEGMSAFLEKRPPKFSGR